MFEKKWLLSFFFLESSLFQLWKSKDLLTSSDPHLDIPVWQKIMAYVLTFFQAFYLAQVLAFFLANILACYLAYFLTFFMPVYPTYCFWHSIRHIVSDILFGISFWHSYVLGMYSNILIWNLAFILAFLLASSQLVRRCPLGSGADGWGPAPRSGTCGWNPTQEKTTRITSKPHSHLRGINQ